MSSVSATTSDSRAAKQVIYGLSVFVSLAVAAVIYLVPPAAAERAPSVLASVNAALNGAAGCFLVAGFVFIKRRQLDAHRRCMLTAFGLSSLFLVTYLLHHAQVGSVSFQGTGWVRTVYLALLLPHIVLAAVIVPLALFTIYRGWTGRLELHRKVARVTLPLWLYVSISGVTIYWMLYHL
jgi:putative membrane protein